MNEPQVLTPKRTEEGKRMRKDYEAHKVTKQRKEMQQLEPREDGISNTLTTAQKDNYLMVPSNTAEGYVQCEVGGVLDISYPSSTTRRGRVQEGGAVAPTLTCGCETTHARIEIIENSKDMNNKVIINNDKEGLFSECNERNTREVLCILRKEVGAQAFYESFRGLECFQSEEVLQQGMYEESICKEGCEESNLQMCAPISKQNSECSGEEGNEMRGLWKGRYQVGSTPQRLGLQEQFIQQFNDCLQKLPFETALAKECLCYLRKADGWWTWLLQQTLFEMEEAWKSIHSERKGMYRIRKLTEREAFRLMGVKDEDSDKIREVVSKSQCYKLAGNSIVVDVMVYMFDQLFFGNTNTNQQLELF